MTRTEGIPVGVAGMLWWPVTRTENMSVRVTTRPEGISAKVITRAKVYLQE